MRWYCSRLGLISVFRRSSSSLVSSIFFGFQYALFVSHVGSSKFPEAASMSWFERPRSLTDRSVGGSRRIEGSAASRRPFVFGALANATSAPDSFELLSSREEERATDGES